MEDFCKTKIKFTIIPDKTKHRRDRNISVTNPFILTVGIIGGVCFVQKTLDYDRKLSKDKENFLRHRAQIL
jgi:hypothetical protein